MAQARVVNVDVNSSNIMHFDCSGELGSLAPRWKKWLRGLEYFITGKGVANAEQKKALLLHSAGPQVQDLYETLQDPGPPPDHVGDDNADAYQKAVRTLNAYFSPRANIPYERHLFRQIKQEESETVDQFITKLRQQATNCSFTNEEESIRDQVIDSCRSGSFRRKLLEEGADLTLQKVQQLARAMEALDIQAKAMDKDRKSTLEVNAVQKKKTVVSTGTPGKFIRKCFRCGQEGHVARYRGCPGWKLTCSKCNKKGHATDCCRTKKKEPRRHGKVRYVDSQEDEYAFHVHSSQCGSPMADVVIGGVQMRVMIDSGASTSIVDRHTWEDLKRQGVKCKSEKTDVKHLFPYGCKEPLEVVGKFLAVVQSGSEETEEEFLVLKNRETRDVPLLGRECSQKLNLLRLGPCALKEDVMSQYKDCFTGLGKLKGYQAKIHTDPSVKPIAQKPRRIPFSLRSKVEDKLQELMDLDIIEKVSGPTPWVSPVVVVPKSRGDIRLCVDMRQANRAVIRERHPIPTFDEVLENMKGSTVFSKLDLNMGFHQIELEEESRSITTFVTHTGLYRYKRLNFGISMAPEIYQNVIHQVIADCEGAENISDDIIVHGKGTEEHDANLEKTMQKIREKGLTLNPEKCQFRMSELEFVGHTVSGRGISPTEARVKAVAEAEEPKNASEVRSFLGLVNFSAKFIPNLATKAEPLRRLTRKGTEFIWGSEQAKAFSQLKEDLARAENLAGFDKDAEKTQVITDASPVGLGAVLLQEQNGEVRVISYASRTLTDVERRYSQTEKEALALVWACEKFYVFLYGIEFEILTDHKPLEVIYSAKSNPPARIQRWVLRLQPYSFKVRYLPGPQNIADALSRLTKEKPVSTDYELEAENYVRFVAVSAVPRAMTAQEIERESATDEELEAVRTCIGSGRWDKSHESSVKFFPMRSELCVLGKLVLRGTRIVPPQSLRKQMLSLAHEGHLGVVGTKQRLRTKVWWPGIDKDVEKYVKTCHGCQLVGLPNPPEPMKPTELPTGPWQDLAVDLLGPLPSGDYICVCVDYYSRFYEIDIMKDTTTERIIRSLDRWFVTHGLPVSISSDNGPQFVSETFKKYLRENAIIHRKVTPLWPQANGEVERQNRSLMKRIRIAQAEKRDWKKAIQEYLIAYRSTPHATTGVSPAELLFGRKIRTKLPDLQIYVPDEEVRDRDLEKKEKSRVYTDAKRRAQECDLRPGDPVLMRQERQNKMSTNFEHDPYEVISKHGNSVVVQSPAGVKYKRNVTQVKKFHESAKDCDGAIDSDVEVITMNDKGPEGTSVEQDQSQSVAPEDSLVCSERPSRTRAMPKRFQDYVMSVSY